MHAARGGDLLGQLDREAVGVVQHEGVRARDGLRASAQQVLEPRQPRLEGLHESRLLLLEQAQDAVAVPGQLLVVGAEDLDGARCDRGEEGVVDAEPLARAPARHGAAQQAAQHVAGALIAGQRALGHREGERAHVVGDDARVAQVGGPARRAPGLRQHLGHQRGEDVGLEDGVHALQDEREPLEAHAGVDARARQRLERAVGLGVELREDEVPELHVAVAVVAR